MQNKLGMAIARIVSPQAVQRSRNDLCNADQYSEQMFIVVM
jgi:hypothetical protein